MIYFIINSLILFPGWRNLDSTRIGSAPRCGEKTEAAQYGRVGDRPEPVHIQVVLYVPAV